MNPRNPMSDRALRTALIKLASSDESLRPHLLPLLKTGMEFGTQNELDTYLKAHPDADKSNHSVKKSTRKNAPMSDTDIMKKYPDLTPSGVKSVKSGKLPVTSDVRHPFLEMGDKVHGTEEAMNEDPTMKKDTKLKGLMEAVKAAQAALQKYMDATYVWD